ncbi:hypothetical protein PG994_004829 [Apiospora phragmitis]|uniref:Ubiquitin-like protease family profile domain-containing protein n=1 Tax=Apiospora phragmitis TaxID=2905665 RepID=A0ABR1VRP5_9PEZI
MSFLGLSSPGDVGSSPANPIALVDTSSQDGDTSGSLPFDPLAPLRTRPVESAPANPESLPDYTSSQDGGGLAPPPPDPVGSPPANPVAVSDTASEDGGGNTGGQSNNRDQELKLGLVLCSESDRYQHISTVPSDTTGIALPHPAAAGNINSLHSLQANINVLITAMRTLRERIVPQDMRDANMVYLANWEEEAHFEFGHGQSEENQALSTQKHRDLLEEITIGNGGRIGGNRQMAQIRQHAWSVLTVNYDGNHWTTVIIALSDLMIGGSSIGYYNRVERLSVLEGLDPTGGRGIANDVYGRFEALLRRAGLEFPSDIPTDWRRPVWVPTQHDADSCGVRAYVNIKTFMRRLNHRLFDPMPGWFNYELERWEMIGSNAAAVVRACDYHARVAVEIVQQHQDGLDAKEALNLPDRGALENDAWPDKEQKKVLNPSPQVAPEPETVVDPDDDPEETPPEIRPEDRPENQPNARKADSAFKPPLVPTLVFPIPKVHLRGSKRRFQDFQDITQDGSGPSSSRNNEPNNPFARRQNRNAGVYFVRPAQKKAKTTKNNNNPPSKK